MKRFIAIAIGCAFLTSFAGAAAAGLEAGVGGMAWGTDVQQASGLKRVDANGEIEYYRPLDREYQLFGTSLQTVIFGFYRQKYFATYIPFEDLEFYGEVKRQLTQRLGPPKIVLDDQGRAKVFRWRAERTHIKLKVDEGSAKFKLSFYYIPIARDLNESQMESFLDKPNFRFFPIERDKRPDALPILEF